MFWIRLDPISAGVRARGSDDPAAGRAALRRLFGCHWIGWAPSPESAWQSVLGAFNVGEDRRVVAPVGVDPVVAKVVRRAGAALVEVDLDRDTGFPVWPTAPAFGTSKDDVYIVEHRHGRPCPPPPVRDGDIVIEHVTDGVGSTVDGRAAGSLGAAMVCALGRPPFARSTGALVGTGDPVSAASLAAGTASLEDGASGRGALWSDATRADDWLAGCRAAAEVYTSAWRGARLPVRPLDPAPGADPSWSAYCAVVPDPDVLIRVLADHGVEARRPLPSGLAAVLTGTPGAACDGARAFYRQIIQLPNHPDLGLGELLHVADVVRVHLRACMDAGEGGRDARERPGIPN